MPGSAVRYQGARPSRCPPTAPVSRGEPQVAGGGRAKSGRARKEQEVAVGQAEEGNGQTSLSDGRLRDLLEGHSRVRGVPEVTPSRKSTAAMGLLDLLYGKPLVAAVVPFPQVGSEERVRKEGEGTMW